jgi:hypothetical protein
MKNAPRRKNIEPLWNVTQNPIRGCDLSCAVGGIALYAA